MHARARKLFGRFTYANVMSTFAVLLFLSGGAAYAANTVFSADIVNGEVKTADLANDSVNSAKITNNTVYSGDVRDDTLPNGGLTSADLAANSVGASEIADGAIGPAEIARPVVHQVGAAGEPALDPQWRAYNEPPFGNLSFYKDSSGVVHLTGLTCFRRSDNPASCDSDILLEGTLPIFTLPPGFRPASQVLFTTLSNDRGDVYRHTRIDITTAGLVFLSAPPEAGLDWVSFDGISFLTQ